MDPHYIGLPAKIVLGNGVLERVPRIFEELNTRGSPLVLTGENTREVAGNRVREALLKTEKGTAMELVREASRREAERLGERIPSGLGAVISVGGGGVIDVGKLLAHQNGVPFISVPTAPSHDGIASERVSLKDGNRFHSIKAASPVAVVADIRILREAPYRLIASGGADVISNYTAVSDWKLARSKGEYYSEYAAALSLLSSEIVLKSANMIREREERGIRNLVEALISSSISMSLVNSSRPASGSEHMFSHALDQLNPGKGPLHGEQCGIGSILFAYLQGGDWKRIREGLRNLGAPATAGELGIEKGMIIEAMLRARSVRERYTVLDEKPLDRERALEICRATGVTD